MPKEPDMTMAVTEAVEKTADAAERIHKSVARLPLDVLRRAELVGKAAGDLERLQDHAIGAVYDLVRGINAEAGRLVSSIVAGPEHPKPRPARSSPKAA